MFCRYKIYDYIRHNSSKLYSEAFQVKIGNLLPAEYETENGEFLFDIFFNNYLLQMFKDAEKIIIYIVPFVFKVNLKVILYDHVKLYAETKDFQCFLEGKNTISIINQKNHFDLIINKEFFNKYKNVLLFKEINEKNDKDECNENDNNQFDKPISNEKNQNKESNLIEPNDYNENNTIKILSKSICENPSQGVDKSIRSKSEIINDIQSEHSPKNNIKLSESIIILPNEISESSETGCVNEFKQNSDQISNNRLIKKDESNERESISFLYRDPILKLKEELREDDNILLEKKNSHQLYNSSHKKHFIIFDEISLNSKKDLENEKEMLKSPSSSDLILEKEFCVKCKKDKVNYQTYNYCQRCLDRVLLEKISNQYIEYLKKSNGYHRKGGILRHSHQTLLKEIYFDISANPFKINSVPTNLEQLMKVMNKNLQEYLKILKKYYCTQCYKYFDEHSKKSECIYLPCDCFICGRKCLDSYFETMKKRIEIGGK